MARRVSIIGNGDIDPVLGPAIDDSDRVIRFNDCRSYGPGGTRTDVVAVCNTGRPGKAMTQSGLWPVNPAVRAAGEIWCVREAAHFDAMRQRLAVTHPELDDFCDDYTEGYRAIAEATGKTLHIIPTATHKATEAMLAPFDPEPYVVPSSGLIAIVEAMRLEPDAEIRLAGFGHQGWEWHPFAAERRLVDHLASQGRLARLPLSSPHPLSQGA